MTTIPVTRRTKCRLCDSSRLELVVPLAPTPVAEKYVSAAELADPTPSYPLDLYMCLECGHVQLVDVVDPSFLFSDYTYASSNTQSLVKHFDDVARSTCERFKLQPNSLVVDVGSNDGSLLRCFKNRGMQVLGIDPAEQIANRATQAGIPTIPEFLTPELACRVRQERGSASVVCAFNVFAHADNLAGMADDIRRMLAPDGIFIVEFSYLLDIIDRVLLGTIFHEHLSHHSVKPIAAFLKRHGLELINVERNMIQGGSVVAMSQQVGGPYDRSSSVEELTRLEKERGLDRPDALKAFDGQLKEMKRKLGKMMTEIKQQGRSLWGYGAARSGTTLIAQMDLGNVIKCIVDDSPEKQNKFSPGDHIPIRPSSALLQEKPDYVFILAWIHADRIIEKNQAYLRQGGRFIVCFPEIRVISARQ